MKNFLRYTWWGFLYFLYFLFTMKERNEYIVAQGKGMDCYKSHDDSYILYGSATVYHFDPTKPPTRRYLTWKKFLKQRKDAQLKTPTTDIV